MILTKKEFENCRCLCFSIDWCSLEKYDDIENRRVISAGPSSWLATTAAMTSATMMLDNNLMLTILYEDFAFVSM